MNSINNPIVKLNTQNSMDHSPVVRLDIEDDDRRDEGHMIIDDNLIAQVRNINLEKRVVSKFVEITTRTVYTFEDGSTKEVTEKNNHTFLN
jgi:hypothetical protein